MANRYWVGGSGTWDTTTTTNWSASSGGAGGASVPTVSDSVFFDQAGTYTVTMTGALACLDLAVSAGTVTFSTGTTPTLNVRGGFSIIAGTVWGLTGTLTFSSTTAKTITTSGVSLSGSVTFNGVGGSWQLQDAFTIPSTSTITLSAGTFDINSYSVTSGIFSVSGSSARTLAFGASGTITIIANGTTIWNATTVTNLTVTGNKRVNVTNTGASATTITTGTPSEAQAVDFYVTSGSYAISFGSNVFARTVDFTGYSGNWGGGTAATFYGSLIISASMTVGIFSSFSFSATSGSWVFNQNGVSIPGGSTAIAFGSSSASTATYNIQSAIAINGTFTLRLCTLNTNGYSISAGSYADTSTGTRAINFGASTALFSTFSISSSTGLTFNAGTSSISVTANGATFSTPGLTFYNVAFTSTAISTATLNGANTFNNLSFPARTGSSGISIINIGANQTINGALALPAGTSQIYRTFLLSSAQGTQRTLTVASITAGYDYLDFRDIVISGAAAPIAPPSAGDCGNNSGITFPVAKTVYFVSANASTAWGQDVWSSSSGGAAALSNFPLAQDTATFDSNSRPAVNGVVNIDSSWNIGSVVMSARTSNMTLTFVSATNSVFYGSVTLGTGVALSFSSGSINFSGPGTRNLSSAGKTWPTANLIGGGTLTLQSSFTVSGTLSMFTTNLNINSQTTSIATLSLQAGTHTIANGTLTATNVTHTDGDFAVGTGYNVSVTGTYTFNGGSITINDGVSMPIAIFSSSNSNARTINFGTGQISLTANGNTIWTTQVATNFAYTGTFKVAATYTGSVGTRTLTQGGTESTVQPISTSGSSGFILNTTSTDSISLTGSWGDIDLTGAKGTYSAGAVSAFGNFNAGSTMTFAASASTMTFAATSGTKTITSNGNTFNFPIIFNGAGGRWQLQDSVIVGGTRTTTLTAGTLELNNYTFTTGLFNVAGSTVRSIAFGSGNITVNGTGTVWTGNTMTGFTYTGTPTVNVSNNSATATTIWTGGTESQLFDFNITTGTYTLTETAASYRSLNFTGFAGTVANISRFVYGSLTLGNTATFTAGANETSLRAASGSWNITSNGTTFPFPISIGTTGAASTYTLQDALTVSSGNYFGLNYGTVALNGYTLTTGKFLSTVTSTRAIAFGGGSIVVNGTGTIFQINSGVGFSYTGTPTVNVANNTATAATINNSTGFTEANALDFNYTTGTYTLTDTGTVYRSVNFTGFSGTVSNGSRTIYGSFNAGFTSAYTAGTNTTTFAATSGTWDITTNGRTLDFPVTFNGVGGAWNLQGALTVGSTRTTTLSGGTLNLNGYTLTTGGFSTGTGSSGVRTLAFGTSQISVSGNNMTVWNGSDYYLTLTITGTFKVVATYSGSVGTRSVIGPYEEPLAQPISTSGSSGIIFDTVSTDIKSFSGGYTNFDLTGMLGTLANIDRRIYGNFNVGSTITIASGTTRTDFVASSGTKTITSNGQTIDFPFAMGNYGSTYQLQDALNLGTRGITFFSGTFDANNYNVTAASVAVAPPGVPINLGSGTWTITGSGTPWGVASASTTFTGTATITLTSSSAKTFNGAGATYPTLNQGGAGALTIVGNNTFTDITSTYTSTGACAITLPASGTQTLTNFTAGGTAGKLLTLNSSTAGTRANLVVNNDVNLSYTSVKDSNVSGGFKYSALNTSGNVNAGNNFGWVFSLGGGSFISFF